MKRTHRLLTIAMLVCLAFTSCGTKDTHKVDEAAEERTADLMEEAWKTVGFPNIKNFTQLKFAKQVLELLDDPEIINYAYLVGEDSGNLRFLGKCINYGLPFSVQYTSPMRSEWRTSTNKGTGVVSMPQPDPNGLFMPTASDATWLLLLDSLGNQHVSYMEGKIFVTPIKMH